MDSGCSDNNHTLGLQEWLETTDGDKDNAIGRSDLIAAIAENFEIAIVLTDRDASVICANRAGQNMLNVGDGLTLRGRILTSKSARVQQALKSAILSVNQSEAGNTTSSIGSASDFLISRSEKLPLTVRVVATCALGFGSEATTMPHAPNVAVLVSDPELRTTAGVRRTCQLYGLTPAEAKVSELLIDGSTISEIAERMTVQPATVRAYLKHIFLKTGVRRQSMLIRLLLTSRVPITVQS